jgi:hypothetical protein
MDPLLFLTAAALSGIVQRPNGGHGVPPRSAEQLAREAVELGRAAHAQLEPQLEAEPSSEREPGPKPRRGGR